MINASSTSQNIVYLNYKSSGLASTRTDTTVIPNAVSNITKGRVLLACQTPVAIKPISIQK